MSRRKPPSPRHKVMVEIAGEKHVLRSDAPPEYTRAVAAYVDTTLRALPGSATLEQHRAAILAALSITDELFRAREEIRYLREDAERRAVALAELLEDAAGGADEEGSVDADAGEDAASGEDASGDADSSAEASEASSDAPGGSEDDENDAIG